MLSTEAVGANLWWEACPSAAGVWRQRDDALCSPQYWGIHHYALELEDAALIAGRVEDAPRPVDLFVGRRVRRADHRDLRGVDGDLGVESDRDRVVGSRPATRRGP